MRQASIALAPLVALTLALAGCGDSSSTDAAKEAGSVAVAYTGTMSRLDFKTACALEFTNRRGPAYRDMTEADKKRECERGWRENHPLQPGASGPPELGEVRHLFGLRSADVQSAELSGNSAPSSCAAPRPAARREGDRWLVYRVEMGELISP